MRGGREDISFISRRSVGIDSPKETVAACLARRGGALMGAVSRRGPTTGVTGDSSQTEMAAFHLHDVERPRIKMTFSTVEKWP